MNSLRPHGLLLANHFDDVDTLLIKIIHYGRQTLFSSILLLLYVSSSHRISLLNLSISYFTNHKPRCLKQGLKASIEGNAISKLQRSRKNLRARV
ncbi:hypothetical protein HanRHA438_Chr02g0082291 [Helianthus annuus]|nr:hypothetical protein HanRHA438_Chr02g0082291 [Helianthus annuus]